MSKSIHIRRALLCAASGMTLAWSAPALAQDAAQSTQSPERAQPTTSGGASNTAGPEAQRLPGAGPTAEGLSAAQGNAPVATARDADPDQGIVVLGVRGAQQAAITIKRRAPQIVDSIVAEDIGKLPDNTIADSLQRVPGVQITRDAGEGSGVNIRGIPQVLTTLNGEIFLDAGAPLQQGGQSTSAGTIASAQPNFGDVPASLFAGVDVIKSPTADQISGGISGILALKTRRPLDLSKGLTETFSAQGDYGFKTKEGNQSYNGLIGYNNGKWGALIGFAYTDETLANYNPNTAYSYDPITDAQAGFDLRKDGAIGNSTAITGKDFYYQPIYFGANNEETSRRRTGINGSFQYKFDGGFTATADLAYLHLNQRDRTEEAEVTLHSSPSVLQPGANISPDGALLNGTYNLPGANGDGFFQDHSFSGLTSSDATNVSLALNYDNGGPLRASVRYVGAVAQQNFSSADVDSLAVQRTPIILPGGRVVNADPNGLAATTAGVSTTGDTLSFNLPGALSNPAYYSAQSIWANGNNLDANFNVGRGDVAYDVNWGPLKTLEAGVRYSQRIIKFNAYKQEVPLTGTDSNGLYYYNDSLIPDPKSPIGATSVPLRPFSSIPDMVVQAKDFGPIKGIPTAGLPFVDPKSMDDSVAFEQRLFGVAPIQYTDPTASYRVTEKETSGYFQADFGGEHLPLIGLSYSGNIGVRVVNTELAIRNFETNGADYIGAGGSYNGVLINQGVVNTTNSYTDPLPELNFQVDLTESQKLRFAFNREVARQDLSTLAAGYVASYEANGAKNPTLPTSTQLFLGATSGNPNLDPFRANLVQGSYEWYFHHSSLLSVAAFYVDVESFPQAATVFLTGQQQADGDGVVRAGGPVSTTVNGGGGSVKGFELGYEQAFDFLPGWLSGFGAIANYTYSDSETGNTDSFGNSLPIPNNSKHQVNGILYYQKGPWQARVAYNWRSEQFDNTYGIPNGTLAIYTKPVGFLDASASYDVNPHFTVYVQGTNLTSSSLDRYAGFEDNYYNQNIFESRIFFGIRLRN